MLHTCFCTVQTGLGAAKAAQSLLLPELKLPKASAAKWGRATTVFPVTPEGEGETHQGRDMPVSPAQPGPEPPFLTHP